MHRYGLRNDQWKRIENVLPGPEDSVRVTAKDNRLFVETVLYRYRAGIAWRDLPERFGDFRVIHTRHTRWCKTGVWERIFKLLGEDQAIGRSKGGLSTKIHTIGDALIEHIEASALLADKAYDADERVLKMSRFATI